MTTIVSGPMFERDRPGMMKVFPRPDDHGAHYSVWHFDADAAGKADPDVGRESLREMFPRGKAEAENFVLFSTSGVHGTYITLEDIEANLERSPTRPESDEEWTDLLTVLVVQPRIVCLRCGVIRVRKEDLPWLFRLRASSVVAVAGIGRD